MIEAPFKNSELVGRVEMQLKLFKQLPRLSKVMRLLLLTTSR